MNKKPYAQIAVAVAVAVIIAGAVAVAYFRPAPTSTGVVPDPNAVAPSGSVTAVSASSISIQQQDAVKRTFAIGPATRVMSQVSSGQAGKGFDDIAVGDMVILRPSASDPDTVQFIQLVTPPGGPEGAAAPAAQAPSGPPASFIGSVVSVSPSMLVVKPEGATSTPVQVEITAQTAVRSNVLNGQKGKAFSDIAVGSPVFIAGTTGASSVIASTIQVLVPIEELAR